MREYLRILEQIPIELREPIAELVEVIENRLRSEFSVTRQDFNRLENVVAELAQMQKETRVELTEIAQAQKRTDQTMAELAQAQKETRAERNELVQAQKRTDQAMAELAQAQKETRAERNELVQAQKRTNQAMAELAQAQKRTEEQVARWAQEQQSFRRTFDSQIGGLGARWGVQTEASFRNAMDNILEDLGFRVEQYLERDLGGKVHGHPDQVELDVVIQDGKLIVIEIKSSMSKSDVYIFERKVEFYIETEDRTVDRKLIVSPFVDTGVMIVADKLGIEVFTDINEVS